MHGRFGFYRGMLIALWAGINVFADNPVVQTCYTSDPAPMVYNGRVYIYTTHDSDNAVSSYLISNWKCYSSDGHGELDGPRSHA